MSRTAKRRHDEIHHPLFARMYERITAYAEKAGAAEHRRRLLADTAGSVVEVGAGIGTNFSYYPDTVTDVIAVEPEPYLRGQAEAAARRASVPISVVPGTAEHLPLDDVSVDVGVASLVLCSVPDPMAALAELHRVIRPGGELRFYEHVAADNPKWASRQRIADHLWPHLIGGCHLTRYTERAICDAGFTIEEVEHLLFQPCLTAKLAAPHILGRARRG
jgi:SAM-dependent methyltransferase